MIYLLLQITLLARSETPITDYLKSESPCTVCHGLNQKIHLEVQKNESTQRQLKDKMLQLCKEYDKLDDATCSLIIRSHFNDLYYSHNESKACDFVCSNYKVFQFYVPVNAKKKEKKAEALSMIDCNICEMVVGFAVEQGTLISTANTGKIFREQCKEVPLLKEHCHIFTDEIANKMVDHLLTNTHPFELCTFVGYCP